MKVFIAVTHLLGTGHLSRALTLARAFLAAGHQVRLASGGTPAPQLNSAGVDFLQLPPLRSDGVNFSQLLTPDAQIADSHYMAARATQLCTAMEQLQPDVLITELYPFGRRSLRHEFLALLKAAKGLPKPPIILSSIRDILAPPSKPEKATKADEILAAYYDAVLVHSDPNATKLEISWPVSPLLQGKLRYTGYVAPPAAPPHPDRLGEGEILVSAGGGNVGEEIYRTALEAARLMPGHTWRLLVGGQDALSRINDLQQIASPAILEPARPDFRQMLLHAAASVSMCGYNTALDLLQAGPPGLLVPFDAGNEVEQGLRANSLAPLPGFEILTSAELTAETLVERVSHLIAAPRRERSAFQFDGAARSVEIAEDLAGAR